MSLQFLLGSHWCPQQLVERGPLYLLADWVTASLEVAAEAVVEVEVEVAFEALAPSLQEAVWERTRLAQVWGGCQRGGASEGGL